MNKKGKCSLNDAPERERYEEIYKAAELGQVISFHNGLEARIYRLCYIRTHVGVIDIDSVEVTRLLKAYTE